MTTGNTPSDPTPEAIAEQFMALAMDVVPTIMMGLKGLFGGDNITIVVNGMRKGYEDKMTPCKLIDAEALGVSISIDKDGEEDKAGAGE